MAFYTQQVRFDDLSLVLRIYKKQKKSLDEVVSFFSKEENIKSVYEVYSDLSPIAIQEAMQLENLEHRMVALSAFTIEEIINDLKAEIVRCENNL